MTTAVRAHRLTLDAAEFALLVALAGRRLPPGFAPPDVPRTDAARPALERKRVIVDGAVHASVLANLDVLARPQVLIRTDVARTDGELLAAHAVTGPLGASLFAAPAGGAELSLFDALDLGRELLRAVPLPPPRPAVDTALGAITAPAGRLPLDALEAIGPLVSTGATAGLDTIGRSLALHPDELRLAVRVAGRSTGTLRALVSGPAPGAPGEVVVGQVVWLSTSDSWLGVRPDPDAGGRRMVVLDPVAREAFGAWLAPHVAGVLG